MQYEVMCIIWGNTEEGALPLGHSVADSRLNAGGGRPLAAMGNF